ncbi:hypothetical protein M501DRAFT_1022474 [Patellaria atrata CBS 101060]|uniref:BHLH domain-containing protein n=1 Tax=Patellaria atrata CBS 101060 TaxID=1346257 RepID=A0A9P4VUH6_9PEZI|nr:hypothetical protein M501DRAFT_1022474 [Patellaria atrata CBS 101060]
MAGTGSPYIKDEEDELQYNPNRFMAHNGYDMQHFNNDQTFGNSHAETGGVNPSDLTMGTNIMNNQYGSHVMSSDYGVGHSRFGDDELADLISIDTSRQGNFMPEQVNMQNHNQGYFPSNSTNGAPVSMAQRNQQMNAMYSNTPDGAPIQSPFVNSFNYNQYPGIAHSIQTTGMANGAFGSRKQMPIIERQVSDSRSPMTPQTPALGGLHLGTPDSSSYSSQPIAANKIGHRQQHSVSTQWDNTPGSNSWIDSPLSSPQNNSSMHPQISEMLGRGASLPNKVSGGQSASVPAYQSQDAKKRRRRESHNAVERRRRDNINERIQDLSRLVPSHRLEDEKIKKHIHNNGPLSPSLGPTGMSPPQATSLLAGGTGRRAAGNITTGLPIEEKDKGPNKGDILNGAVSWTRDLMWMLHRKFQDQERMQEYIISLGGTFEMDESEEEKRMRTELVDAVDKNGPDKFFYSRGPGSGLRVPKHTTLSGDPINNPRSPQSLSPAMQAGGSGNNSGNAQHYWSGHHSGSSGRGSFSLKEEDEYNMDMS